MFDRVLNTPQEIFHKKTPKKVKIILETFPRDPAFKGPFEVNNEN